MVANIQTIQNFSKSDSKRVDVSGVHEPMFVQEGETSDLK